MSYMSDKIARDEKHRYFTPVGVLPSVTTITGVIDDGKSGALIGWAVRETCDYLERKLPMEEGVLLGGPTILGIINKARKEATRIRDEAANTGRKVHDEVEKWVKAHVDGMPYSLEYEMDQHPEVVTAWNAFITFAMGSGFRPLRSEQMVYSRKYKFAGTLDIIAVGRWRRQRKDKVYLIDCKTGTVIPQVHGPQIAAYAKAWEEMSGEKVEGIAILELNKTTGEPKWHDFSKERKKHFRVFLAAKKLFTELNRDGRKKNG